MQFSCHCGRFDEAAFSVAMPCQPPKIGAIVDVERGLQAMLARKVQCFHHGSFGARVRQMRAGGHHRAGRGNKTFVNVIFTQRHVGAVFAVEDQRKMRLVTNTQQNQRGQPFGIGLDALHVDAFAR